MKDWYNLAPILSRSAILNFIFGGRNIGKTWALKRRTWRRAIKKGKKCIWVRRTKAEAIQCASSFYTSKDLQKFCGLKAYNPQTKKGDVRHNGRNIERRRGRRWEWFIKVCALSEFKNMRSSDDVECDTIIFDEFTTTPEKYIMYRGNEASDFIDICVSIMRQHEIRVFLSGNKESVFNPIYTYFNLPVIPLKYEGIRLFKDGTIAVQQVGDRDNLTAFQQRFDRMLKGTDYGKYMHGAYKNQAQIKVMNIPPSSECYLQTYIRGQAVQIRRIPDAPLNAPRFILCPDNNKDGLIFTDTTQRLFRHQKTLIRATHIIYFRDFIQAVADSRIAYSKYEMHEAAQGLFKWLRIQQ